MACGDKQFDRPVNTTFLYDYILEKKLRLRIKYSYFLIAYSVKHVATTVRGAENKKCRGKEKDLNCFLQIGKGRIKKDNWDLLEMRDQEQGSVHQTDK